ncbi:unnamed protein product [Mytilus coruscus]|uniref:Major facilitator superfamily (MFS) profile domain-containing protein n=1 Tax=Mytilus coruscus TaxID=42192 RepID=A0A6J8DEZ0_MYTCO|nr:unnamed protein product [Mytilus coruscus]
MIFCGFNSAIGLIYIELTENFGVGKENLQWIGSMQTGLAFLMGPLVSSVSSLISCRRIVIVGGCLQFVGYLLSAFVSSVNILYITLGIVVGIGNGLTITSSLLILNEFFDRKLPLATGIVLSGAGIGNIIFSPLIDLCLTNYGYQGTLMISAATALHVQITAATFSQKRRKQGQTLSFSKQLSDMMDINLLKTPAFAFSIMTNMLWSMGFYVPFAFLPNSAVHYGIDGISIPWLISIIGCSSSLGRPFFGWMGVTFYRHKIVLYSFMLTVCGLSILMMQIWRKFYLLAIACAIFGGTSVETSLWKHYCGNITVETSLWKHHSGNITVETSQWKRHSGNITVETSLWKHHCGNITVETSLWKHHSGNITMETSLWKHHCGNITVETSLWKHHCGNITVETSQWKHYCGNITVETSLWKHHCGNITVETSQWKHHRGTVCLSTSILPDIVLPKSLCNSVGITLLFQGLGCIIGTPVAGGLTEMVRNDGIIYMYGCITFLCAAMTLIPVIYITTSEKHRQRFNQKALVTIESEEDYGWLLKTEEDYMVIKQKRTMVIKQKRTMVFLNRRGLWLQKRTMVFKQKRTMVFKQKRDLKQKRTMVIKQKRTMVFKQRRTMKRTMVFKQQKRTMVIKQKRTMVIKQKRTMVFKQKRTMVFKQKRTMVIKQKRTMVLNRRGLWLLKQKRTMVLNRRGLWF